MWPAPAHSAGLNAIYYDPRLTYEPPVDSAGASYPQMDAGSTSNWSQVPADPWASTITNVDLTAAVTDGLWCNSDWSLGSAADPTQCRYNGTGGAAFGTVSAAEGQDYTYPWAPPGFNVSASAGATTTSTYAAQKVTLNGTLTGTAINATSWNATSQNQKYFYENENILWCDPTSPSWPQTGPQIAQACGGLQAQTCSAFAGQCANPVNGACNNAPFCNGLVTGTCSGFLPALCQGSAGACNGYVAPACTGAACVGSSAQTCNGTSQTCPTSAQTCSGPFNQTCVLPGTQTCQPQVCSVTYNPPGCNLLPPDPAKTPDAPPLFFDGAAASSPVVAHGWIPAGADRAPMVARAQRSDQLFGQRSRRLRPGGRALPITTVAGWGVATDTTARLGADRKVQFQATPEGDGTIPFVSASWLQGVASFFAPLGFYPTDNLPEQHSTLWNAPPVRALLAEVLTGAAHRHYAYAAVDPDDAINQRDQVRVRVVALDANGNPLPAARVRISELSGPVDPPTALQADGRGEVKVARNRMRLVQVGGARFLRFQVKIEWTGGDSGPLTFSFTA